VSADPIAFAASIGDSGGVHLSETQEFRSSDWSGSLVFGTGLAVYVGAGSAAATHRHSAIQVIRSTRAAIRLCVAGIDFEARMAIVPADVDHSIVSSRGGLVVVLVEPSGALGRALNAFALDHVATDLFDSTASIASPPLDPHARVAWARGIVALLARDYVPPHTATHRQEVVDAVRLVLDQLGSVPRLTEIARRVGLSPRQLSRSFTEQIGMPFRRFVVWSRVRRAVLAVRDGHDLTNAAAGAGFADSAHFSRVFLAMFGLQPSKVLPFVEVVETDVQHI
jgi:AraC-like DNA-binding protein